MLFFALQVLDITKTGHRKRILTSLGEKPTSRLFDELKDFSLSKMVSTQPVDSFLKSILFKKIKARRALELSVTVTETFVSLGQWQNQMLERAH